MSPQRPTSRSARALHVAISLLLASQTLSAQTSGRVAGVVRNAAKAPVAGALVTVINQVTTRRVSARTTTDGRFTFKLPAGAYRIIVDAPDAVRFDRENVIVEAGKDVPLEIELKPLPKDAPKSPQIVDPTANE